VQHHAADQLHIEVAHLHGAPAGFAHYRKGLWKNLVQLIDWVCDHWRQPDYGIWEVRGGAYPFLYSRVMCWVAIDRGVRWLVIQQRDGGGWDEPQFTGTGFPGDFYINYHLYRHVFPVSALGRYCRAGANGD